MCLWGGDHMYTQGSKYQNIKLSDPKYHSGYNFRNKKPLILHTWTLWDIDGVKYLDDQLT